nr:hypothetical protein [uncultured archaeon]
MILSFLSESSIQITPIHARKVRRLKTMWANQAPINARW